MLKRITKDLENPNEDQVRNLKKAERGLRALARHPLPPEKVELFKIRISRRFELAGRAKTKELEARIVRAGKASHNLNMLKNFAQLANGLPRRLAEFAAENIRVQMACAAGRTVKPNSAFALVVAKAVEDSVTTDAERERKTTVRMPTLLPKVS